MECIIGLQIILEVQTTVSKFASFNKLDSLTITKFLTEIRDNDTDGYFTLGENTENEITIQWFRPRTKYRQVVISNYPKPFKRIFYQGIICYDFMNHSFVGSIEPNNLTSCKIWVDCLGNPPGYQPSMRVIVIGH